MAAQLPVYVTSAGPLARFANSTDFIDVTIGGTGATTAAGARTNLGLAIGSNVQAWDTDLDAIAALSSTGIAVRTGAGAWAQRSLATGSSARITVTNADGSAGNPTVDLATIGTPVTTQFVKITTDAYGRVSGTTAVVAGDITGLISGTYLPISGGTLTGFLTLNADPTSALHAATKQYVDSIASGINYKTACRVATVGSSITLAGSAPNTLDGVTLAANDRILVKDQSTASQNGIYYVSTLGTGANGTWTRATDANTSGQINGGTTVWINEGTTNADTGWTVTTDGTITIGTTAIAWTQSSGLGQVVAGNGLTKTGNQLDIGTASSSRIVINTDNIDLATVSNSGTGTFLKLAIDSYGRVTGTTAVVAADIAALLDSDLTALANTSTTGIYVVTAAGTSATVSITGTSGRISVANGSGVSGAPTIDLASGIVTPGTYNSVTTDTYGRVIAGSTVNQSNNVDVLTNGTAGSIAIGQVVYVSGADTAGLAVANSSSACQAVGLVFDTAIGASSSGKVIFDGILTATTTQWNAVTGGSGGLTSGAVYYLSNTTAGQITTTAPTSGYLVPIGRALGTTRLKLGIGPIIQL